MNQRIYNKLYVSKNREEGSSSMLLGYKYDEKAITLAKDKETYFHIPFFSKPLKLSESDLIVNGALGGPFPAASDRIFKNQENYGNYTPYGSVTSPPADGLWFCSWLYYDPVLEESRWLDRFYNPGQFVYDQAVADLQLQPSYVVSNPIFQDKPSTMVFEEGVLYRYFHLGEKSYGDLLTTLGGVSSERVMLDLSNWTEIDQIDSSLNSYPVRFTSNIAKNYIVGASKENSTPSRIFPNTINFNNNYNTSVSVDYDAGYNSSNEFSLSFWANSKNWQQNSFSHLVGNYTSRGEGISLSIEDNQSTPIMVIPETYYGHLLFLNEKGEGYLDKTVQDDLALVSPSVFAINSENNIIVCNVGQFGTMYKMDHTGEILTSTKNYLQEETLFSFFSADEDALQMICGENDYIHVLTKRALYTFNDQLKLATSTPITYNNTVMAFSYNSSKQTVKLELVNEVYDAKYIEDIKWSLKRDGHLYLEGGLYQRFEDGATNFAVGPDGYLWVLHGENNLTIINPKLNEGENKIVNSIIVGSKKSRTISANRKKNISFVNRFDRDTNAREWFCVVYYSDEKNLYFYNLQGVLVNYIYINGLFNSYIVQKRLQSYEKFKFEGSGDFTSYEYKRVFRHTKPFNNKTQLILRTGFKDISKPYRVYKLLKHAVDVSEWAKESWHHFLLTYKNKRLLLYIDGIQRIEDTIEGRYQLTYDTQPSFYIGTPLGSKEGFNTEVQYISNIFNGKIGAVQVYDYAIDKGMVQFFLKSTIVEQNLQWFYTTPTTQYIEQIDKMYKHKLPGSKSAFFNLKLIGTQITDTTTRSMIEEEVHRIIKEIAPIYTDVLKINWID